MENFVETGGLVLPSVDLLITQVTQIENTLPGWWWSLSFSELDITLSVGPDRLVPDPKHLQWMNTREGDLGIIYTTYTHGDERKVLIGDIVTTNLKAILGRLREIGVDHRQDTTISGVYAPRGDVTYRYQTLHDLDHLRKAYGTLINSLETIREAEFVLREFYIGSCGRTVDCSLRGGDDEHTFDHSADFYEGNLGDSVSTALDDLLQEIESDKPVTIFDNGFLKEGGDDES